MSGAAGIPGLQAGEDVNARAENARSRRPHATGEATRELLMVAAERLFAMNGVEGVTLREIQTAAGQANASVITYHFGRRPAWCARCSSSATARSTPPGGAAAGGGGTRGPR